MYADDMVLLSESPEGLPTIFDTIHEYWNDRKLSVNVCKINVVNF